MSLVHWQKADPMILETLQLAALLGLGYVLTVLMML